MTNRELQQMLSYFPDDAEVRFAWQPSYPMESSVGEPVVFNNVVYIPEASHLGYLTDGVAEELANENEDWQ